MRAHLINTLSSAHLLFNQSPSTTTGNGIPLAFHSHNTPMVAISPTSRHSTTPAGFIPARPMRMTCTGKRHALLIPYEAEQSKDLASSKAQIALSNPTKKDVCYLQTDLDAISELNMKKELDQKYILNITQQTLKEILPDDIYTIQGRVKSKESKLGKMIKSLLINILGQYRLDQINQNAQRNEILKHIMHHYWLDLNSSLNSHEELHDSIGIRIIIDDDNMESCYQVLKKIIDAPEIQCFYQIKNSFFKDYIKHAKSNDYQSLHAVIAAYSNPEIQVELQVRTQKMHEVAESGEASHNDYKSFADTLYRLYSKESLARHKG